MLNKRTATNALITIICAGFLVQLLNKNFQFNFELQSIEILKYTNQWYRIFTVTLLHDTSFVVPVHLALNMLALHSLCNQLEIFVGPKKLIAIFTFSLLTGSLFSALTLPINGTSIGASGAIFGLFGALAVVGRKHGIDIKSILAVIGINFVVGFTISNVDWHAHLGGLIGGALAAQLLLVRRR